MLLSNFFLYDNFSFKSAFAELFFYCLIFYIEGKFLRVATKISVFVQFFRANVNLVHALHLVVRAPDLPDIFRKIDASESAGMCQALKIKRTQLLSKMDGFQIDDIINPHVRIAQGIRQIEVTDGRISPESVDIDPSDSFRNPVRFCGPVYSVQPLSVSGINGIFRRHDKLVVRIDRHAEGRTVFDVRR